MTRQFIHGIAVSNEEAISHSSVSFCFPFSLSSQNEKLAEFLFFGKYLKKKKYVRRSTIHIFQPIAALVKRASCGIESVNLTATGTD